ncbi:MAG: SDR family oxidoreductase [Bacteroidota bacterium]
MKTILITGGNRGIGLEICKQLDALNHIIIMGARDLEKGKEAARPLGSNAIAMQLDVTDEVSIHALYAFVEKEFGKLDVLINNAGLGASHFDHGNTLATGIKNLIRTRLPGGRHMMRFVKPVWQRAKGKGQMSKGPSEVSLEEVNYIMETNLYGPWRMIRTFLPLIRKSPEGRIINISSGMGALNSLKGDYPAYRLSKSSLNAMTIMLSKELVETGICVNAMCPGWVRTDMGGPDAPRDVREGADTAVWLATEKKIPNGKFFRDRKIIDW